MPVQTIESIRRVAASPTAVFDLIGDSETWPEWTPIEACQLTDLGDLDGIGEVRVFRMGRVRVREEIVERVPGRRLVYEMRSGYAIKEHRAEIVVEPSATGCEVRWSMSFRAKVPGSGAMYRKAMETMTGRYLDGLAARVENPVTPPRG